jgi:PST family polysaccharide transporter
MYWGIFNSITCIASFFVGLPFGPLGVATAYTIGEYLRTPLLWLFVTRRGSIIMKDMISLGFPHYLGALLSVILVRGICLSTNGPPLLTLTASLITSYLASALVLGVFKSGRITLGVAFQQFAVLFRKMCIL